MLHAALPHVLCCWRMDRIGRNALQLYQGDPYAKVVRSKDVYRSMGTKMGAYFLPRHYYGCHCHLCPVCALAFSNLTPLFPQFYIIHKFVSKPTKKEAAQIAKRAARASASEKGKERDATDNEPIHPQIMALRTPAIDDVTGSSPDLSVNSTPSPSSSSSFNPPTSTQATLSAATAGLVSSHLANGGLEEDGSILHTIVVSQCCFKMGRITIPPALVLAANGMTGARGYSHATPHPEWINEARKLRAVSEGGSLRTLRKFLTSGWKEVQEAARKEGKKAWWDEAMGDEVEETNRRNLAFVEGLRFGMEGARTI
jgi:hypothetical protein